MSKANAAAQSPKMESLLVSLQQHSETAVVPSKSDFEEAIEKLSWLTELEKHDVASLYIQIEELCDGLGFRSLVPKVKFVGMESVGKSSLIEAFLRLPVNYTAEGRATFSPILYRVRKNSSMGDEIKCSLHTIAKYISPDQLSVAIRDHMTNIRERQGVSTTPLIVTIESGHASTRNVTIVDTPGKIRTDVEGDRERSKVTLESIAGIVDTVISEGPDDVIVLVENGAASPGSIDTFRTTIQAHDPHLERTVPVCTHFDSKFSTDYGSTKSASDHFQSWKHVFDKTIPFWVALHNLSSEKRRELGFEGSREEILEQLEENDKSAQKWLGDFVPSLPVEVTSKMGLQATVDAIQDMLNVQFLKKARSIISVFDEFRRTYEQEMETHSISSTVEPGMSENPISGIITDFVNKFVRFYVSSFRGIMPGGKVQDIFKNGFSLADEHRTIASSGDVDPWPKQGLRDDEYSKYVTNAKEKLASGAQRLDRLKCELGVRIMSVEPEEPTDESILNLIGRDFGKDILDLNQAVTQLVRLTGNQLFVASGCQYIGSRAQLILVSHADLVLAMLTSEYPALLANQVFVSEFKNSVYEVFNGLADEFSENIKKQVISTTSSIRMGRPTETEQAFRFLYGFDPDNTLHISPSWRDKGSFRKKEKERERDREREREREKEREREREKSKDGKSKGPNPTPTPTKKTEKEKRKNSSDEDSENDSDDTDSDPEDPTDKRMTREERMRAITKIKVSRDDQIENPRTGKIKSWQYDQARYVFKRQFSLLRLQYWLVVESALHGDVQEKILGPPGIQNLDQLLLQRLLLHETKKTRLSEPELNERYHWREQLEMHKQSINAIQHRLEAIRVVSRKLRVLFELLQARASMKQITASVSSVGVPLATSSPPAPLNNSPNMESVKPGPLMRKPGRSFLQGWHAGEHRGGSQIKSPPLESKPTN